MPLALGTDSLASNAELDMRREMALVRRDHPRLEPGRVWRMATVDGARAVGLAGRVGRVAPGHHADLALFRTASRTATEILDELTASKPEVSAVWIAGRRIRAGGVRPHVP